MANVLTRFWDYIKSHYILGIIIIILIAFNIIKVIVIVLLLGLFIVSVIIATMFKTKEELKTEEFYKKGLEYHKQIYPESTIDVKQYKQLYKSGVVARPAELIKVNPPPPGSIPKPLIKVIPNPLLNPTQVKLNDPGLVEGTLKQMEQINPESIEIPKQPVQAKPIKFIKKLPESEYEPGSTFTKKSIPYRELEYKEISADHPYEEVIEIYEKK